MASARDEQARNGRNGLSAVAVILLCTVWSPVAGQQYTLNFSKQSTRMSWNHGLPSWSYSVPVRLSAVGDSTSMLRISTSASMSSTFDERSERKTWQDNASVSSSVNYPVLGPRASIGIGANMSVRSATLTQQKIRNQTFNFRFQYSPLQRGRFRSLRVNVTPGLITASRANRANLDSTFQEQGVQYNASLRVSPEAELAGKKLTNSLSLGKTDNTLTSNKNRSENFSSSLGYTLPGDVRTNFNLSESRSQTGVPRSVISEVELDGAVVRDTAVAVELRETRSTSLSSSVSFKMGRFDVQGKSSYGENLSTNTASADEDPRNSYFAKDRENKRWSLESSLSGKLTDELVGRTSARFNARDERFLSVRLGSGETFRDPSSDLSDRDLFFNGSLDWQLAENHSLRLSAYANMKRAENPGAPEQDRDTYSNSVSLSYDGNTAGGAKTSVSLENKYLHRVNLDAKRSSDNSRNRDIALSVVTRYERAGINISHNFSISARRTIYDFDRQVNPGEAARKSNIRRGWSMRHSLRRSVLEHIQLNGGYTYKAEDFGILLVEDGVQIVEEDNNDHSLSFGMSYSPSTTFSTTVGYSYRLDRDWDHEYADFQERRILGSRNEHRNLNVSVSYSPGSGNSLTMRGSRSRQRSGTFDSFNVKYSRTL